MYNKLTGNRVSLDKLALLLVYSEVPNRLVYNTYNGLFKNRNTTMWEVAVLDLRDLLLRNLKDYSSTLTTKVTAHGYEFEVPFEAYFEATMFTSLYNLRYTYRATEHFYVGNSTYSKKVYKHPEEDSSKSFWAQLCR